MVVATIEGLYASAVATFGENLLRLRKRAGLTQNALAELMGYSNNSPISAWERDANRELPDPETVRAFAIAIGCSSSELLEGVVTPYDELRARPQLDAEREDVDVRTGYKREDIPVIGEGEASARGLVWNAEDKRWTEVEEWVSRPHDLREPSAYAIVVRNNSMEPMFRRGWRLIISPNQRVGEGEAGFVFLTTGERLIKLVRKAPGGFLLESVNAIDNPPRFVKKGEVEAIHRVAYVKLLK